MKIRNKLILYLLTSILIPTIFITTFVYSRSTQILGRKINELTEKKLISVSLVVQQRLEFIVELTTLISLNPLIQDVLSANQTTDPSVVINEIITLDRALDSYYLSNYYAASSSPMVPHIYPVQKPAYEKYDISTKVGNISSIEETSWYKKMEKQSLFIFGDEKSDAVIIARKLYDLKNVDKAEYAALLTIELKRDFFQGLLSEYTSSKENKICILDENEEIIASSTSLSEAEINFIRNLSPDNTPIDTVLDNTSVVLFSDVLENVPWTMVSISNFDEINAERTTLTKTVFLVLGLCLICALLIALLFSKNISKPIVQLVESMHTVSENDFEIQLQYKKNDEFGYLFGQYKKMIARIKNLIDELYISEMSKQKAEILAKDAQLRFLQSQINPHFLYNTLDSINLLSIKNDVPDISRMINSLSNFFRYSLNKGRDIITLKEELSHTRNYLEIQSIRLGNNLSYSFSISDDTVNAKTIKLTTQPLVENSILHGFQNKSELTIHISAYQKDDKTLVEISDNGLDGEANRLNQLLEKAEEGTESFAIINVHLRLRNTFGNEYGLSYYNNKKGGLTARLTLPRNFITEDLHADSSFS